jgi:hypothetical protein
MSESLPDKQQKPLRFTRDDLPKRGEWYWVTYQESWGNKKKVTELMCVKGLGSNHVKFTRSSVGGGTDTEWIHFKDLFQSIKPEPNWKAVIEKEIEEKKAELKEAVSLLADKVHQADMLPEDSGAPASMLPSTSRVDPKVRKKALLHLRDKALPEAQKSVENITKELVALHSDLVLPMMVECKRMLKIKDKIEDRLFVLELYAGLGEEAVQIAKGKVPDPDTPIAIRQMIRYMDEESLIDYDKGGMDYKKLEDFDAWIARPENYKRLLPEERCVVALQIRRHMKDYGPCGNSFGELMQRMGEHKENMRTYLCIRNGENLWRLATEIDFKPGLLPNRDEFHKPFEEPDKHGYYPKGQSFPFGERKYRDPEIITPDDLRYDEKVEERQKLIFQYNRILFLIQGLLDRSKVFQPHPPMNLSDPDVVQKYLKLIHDEQDGLPSWNPPKWEQYRDEKNASIKIGSFVYAEWDEEKWENWNRKTRYWKEKGIFKVTSIKKDRSEVRLSWEHGETRWGWEFPDAVWNRGRWGEWPKKHKFNHKWVKMEKVFHLDAYVPGDYKKFLCDAYLKGAYLDWAPQLLAGEDHWREVE